MDYVTLVSKRARNNGVKNLYKCTFYNLEFQGSHTRVKGLFVLEKGHGLGLVQKFPNTNIEVAL